MTSIWHLGELANPHSDQVPLPDRVDVAVVGGGITGLTTALLLSEAGASVALLEARRVGEGNTGNSTGNLYATLSAGLAGLRSKWGDGVVRSVVEARTAALALIRDTAARFELVCDIRDCPVHFCAERNESKLLEMLEAEASAAATAGLSAALEPTLAGWPLAVTRQLRIDGQAQFNPLPYAQGLAQALRVRGVTVHEQCRVVDIDAGAGCLTTTAGKLRADQLVFATHSPPGINLVQAEMEAYREYGIAMPAAALPPGVVWMKGDSVSLRSFQHDGESWLVAVGEKVKTGHATAIHHERLAAYVARQFGIAAEQPHWRWSAQQYKPADGLPYIGRSAHRNVFIATGFAADGLVWGTVAARLIADEMAGRQIEIAQLLSPRRFTPVKSAQVWLSENKTVAAELLRTVLPGSAAGELVAVAPGEGRIVEVDGHQLAAYRSAEGELSLLSPICPHMKCRVNWNAADATWDCPCHGSRFDTDGAVIEGPALAGLSSHPLPPMPAPPPSEGSRPGAPR